MYLMAFSRFHACQSGDSVVTTLNHNSNFIQSLPDRCMRLLYQWLYFPGSLVEEDKTKMHNIKIIRIGYVRTLVFVWEYDPYSLLDSRLASIGDSPFHHLWIISKLDISFYLPISETWVLYLRFHTFVRPRKHQRCPWSAFRFASVKIHIKAEFESS